LLGAWDEASKVLGDVEAAVRAGAEEVVARARPLTDIVLTTPLPSTATLFCAAANFTDHMQEMSGKTPPDKAVTRPYFFMKTSRHSLIATNEPIWAAATSQQLDWEAEIAVVIGKPGYRIDADDAMEHVAGYSIVNDLTLRDLTRRSDWHFGNDWFRAKSFDRSAPFGPWITPADFIADPHRLGIRTWVNEDLMQDSTSEFMHFTIPELISYLSEQLTLQPGDVIATGTPAGVGKARGRYLAPGDEVRIEIDGIGTLRNPVLAHPGN
jgi:2-keto-4-pentenoate hydratase/2-oxohepta-3-ene-1,7-dioic acid hydratase in catechol pathway